MVPRGRRLYWVDCLVVACNMRYTIDSSMDSTVTVDSRIDSIVTVDSSTDSTVTVDSRWIV